MSHGRLWDQVKDQGICTLPATETGQGIRKMPAHPKTDQDIHRYLPTPDPGKGISSYLHTPDIGQGISRYLHTPTLSEYLQEPAYPWRW